MPKRKKGENARGGKATKQPHTAVTTRNKSQNNEKLTTNEDPFTSERRNPTQNEQRDGKESSLFNSSSAKSITFGSVRFSSVQFS